MALFLSGSAGRGIWHILIVDGQVIRIVRNHGPILVVFAIAFLEGNTQGVRPFCCRVVHPTGDMGHRNGPDSKVFDVVRRNRHRDRVDVVVDQRPHRGQFFLGIGQPPRCPGPDHAHEGRAEVAGPGWGIDQVFVAMVGFEADQSRVVEGSRLLTIPGAMDIDSVMTIRPFPVAIVDRDDIGTALVSQTQV